MKALLIILVATIFLSGLICLETDKRAFAFRDCIEKVKTNRDGFTVDKEDIDLCTKAYDKRTSRAYELQKAIKRPVINSPMKSI